MAAGPDVYLTWPTTFAPIPAPLPHALPPPVKERSFRSPFGINETLYNFALRPEIPVAFASAYIFGVFVLNSYNRQHDHKPWRISQQTWFKYFVIVHNVLLALYSFATFLAMFRAIAVTLPAWDEAENWRAKTADALCKMHGPRGLGDAATFNTTINIWEAKNTLIHMGYDGNPDPTDLGRLWNEGLAFWGWMFYVSKFYEVIDTLIILAKGKRSATLQTYHHAGAMLCMWAGIRYMSPPIWMFVFINSAIHAMMYTYFALSALGCRVPQALKRTLTSLQIAQFVFGASYAAAHLFVQYDIPFSTPFTISHVVERAASSASSAANSATSAATSAASAVSSFAESPTLAATMGNYIKKLLLRAAGEEGVAERVAMQDHQNQLIPGDAVPRIEEKIEQFYDRTFETRWRTDWTRVNCIDTSGEAFAIYLNLLYLAPLTFLFGRFFVRAYTARGKPRTASQAARMTSEAAREAKNQTEDAVERSGKQAEDGLQKAPEEAQRLQEELKKDVQDFRDGSRNRRVSEKISEKIQDYEEKVKGVAEKLINGKSSSSSRKSSPAKKAQEGGESAIVEDEPEVKEEPAEGEPVKEEPTNEDATKGEPTNKEGEGLFKGKDSEGQEQEPTSSAEAGKQEPEDSEANGAGAEDTKDGETEDTDAMGKSGAIVDHPTEQERDVGEGEGEKDESQSGDAPIRPAGSAEST